MRPSLNIKCLNQEKYHYVLNFSFQMLMKLFFAFQILDEDYSAKVEVSFFPFLSETMSSIFQILSIQKFL